MHTSWTKTSSEIFVLQNFLHIRHTAFQFLYTISNVDIADGHGLNNEKHCT